MLKFQEIKICYPNYPQKQLAKESGCSASKIRRYRKDNSMDSLYNNENQIEISKTLLTSTKLKAGKFNFANRIFLEKMYLRKLPVLTKWQSYQKQ